MQAKPQRLFFVKADARPSTCFSTDRNGRKIDVAEKSYREGPAGIPLALPRSDKDEHKSERYKGDLESCRYMNMSAGNAA